MISSVSARPFSCKQKHECIQKINKGSYMPNSVMYRRWIVHTSILWFLSDFYAMPTRPTFRFVYVVYMCVCMWIMCAHEASILELYLWKLVKKNSSVYKKYKQHLLSKATISIYEADFKWIFTHNIINMCRKR